jgi:outer membrane protein with beta-barrel domain
MRFDRKAYWAVPLLTMILAGPAHAVPVHYGARLGANLATITGDFADLSNPKTKTGLAAGGFVSVSPAPLLGIELDLLYVEKGFKVQGIATDPSGNPIGTTEGFLKLQYLDVPLLAKISLPSMGAVSPYVIGGPNLGIGLNAKFEGGGLSHDFTSDLQKLDWGATGGVGVRWGAGPMSLGLETRYERSFADLWDIQNNFESINQGWMITAWASR